jgi:uncharacterized membrane protein
MNRHAFLSRLRDGLSGLPRAAIDEVVGDYEAHFIEGEAAGRTDAQVAQALGDPDRLARELRAEAGLKRWEEQRNPAAAAGAVLAVFGLATIDILILLPILTAMGGLIVAFYGIGVGGFVFGGVVFMSGLFGHVIALDGSPVQGMLIGVGLMSACVGGISLLTLLVVWLVNGLVAYGRLHYRLLKPEAA